MNFLTRTDDSRKMIFNTIFCVVILCVIYFLYYFKPVAFVYLVTEDAWGEYGTFVCYIFAFVLMIGAMKVDRNLLKPGYILMSLVLFVIGMEEISWGQRLFGIEAPGVVTHVNYQKEINLHNIFGLPFLTIFCYGVIIWVFILPILSLKFKNLQKWIGILGIPPVPSYTIPYFILPLFFHFSHTIILRNEISELLLGVAFVSLVTDIFLKTLKKDAIPGKLSEALFTSCLILTSVAITGLLAFLRPDPYSLQRRIHTMAAILYPKQGLYPQAEELFLYILNNSQLRTQETLLEYGMFLKTIQSNKADAILEKALEEQYELMVKKPDQPPPHRIAGKILKLLNKKDQAQLEFQKSLEKDEVRLTKAKMDYEKFAALKSMGETYCEMGDYDSARSHFEEAIHVTWDRRNKMQAQEWIDKIDARKKSSELAVLLKK